MADVIPVILLTRNEKTKQHLDRYKRDYDTNYAGKNFKD